MWINCSGKGRGVAIEYETKKKIRTKQRKERDNYVTYIYIYLLIILKHIYNTNKHAAFQKLFTSPPLFGGEVLPFEKFLDLRLNKYLIHWNIKCIHYFYILNGFPI